MNNEEIVQEGVEIAPEVVTYVSEETDAKPRVASAVESMPEGKSYKVTNMFATEIASFETQAEADEFVQNAFATNGVTGLQVTLA